MKCYRKAAKFLVTVMLVGATACEPLYVANSADELKESTLDRAQVTAKFFGVSTILLDDGSTAIMTDGFFSRPSFWQFTFGRIAPDDGRIETALLAGKVHRLNAVMVAHSHYDHALDSARVAKLEQALLVGSNSTAYLAEGEGFPAGCFRKVTRDRQRFAFGDFVVTVFKSPHSTGTPGEHRRSGQLTEALRSPADYNDYKEGDTYSFLIEHRGFNILVHPSANYRKHLFAGVRADVVFLGIATLGKKPPWFTEEYWQAVVGETGARLVVPVHWDDFSKPLRKPHDDLPLDATPQPVDDIPRGLRLLREASARQTDGKAAVIKFMPLFKPIDLVAAAGPQEAGGVREPSAPHPVEEPSSCS